MRSKKEVNVMEKLAVEVRKKIYRNDCESQCYVQGFLLALDFVRGGCDAVDCLEKLTDGLMDEEVVSLRVRALERDRSHVVTRPADGAPEYRDPYFWGSKKQCKAWVKEERDSFMYTIERND